MSNLTGKDDQVTAFHKGGSVEFFRSGAYCNLNDIAKPFGKRVANWTRLEGTKRLFKAFEEDPVYADTKAFFDVNEREQGTGKFQSGGGIFVHPDIAIQFAQWCDPSFALWVSRQIRNLLTYGEVNIHHVEWTDEQRQKGIEMNRDDIKDLHG